MTFRFIENENFTFEENGEQRVLQILAKRLDAATVFDVGANVGHYSQLLSGYFPKATIYAFEPVAQTHEILMRRLGGMGNVEILNYGLHDQDVEVDFSVRPDDLTNSSSVLEASRTINPTIDCIIVRVQLRNSGSAATSLGVKTIDFLKIDTEGNDWFVLNGFLDWLKDGRIKAIQFEYGMNCIFTKRLLLDYHKILRENNYIVGKIYPTYVDFRSYHPIDEDFIGPNYLAVHTSTGLEQYF